MRLGRALLAGGKARPARQQFAEIGRHTSDLQSLTAISYSVFCLKKKITVVSMKSMTHRL